MSLNKSETPPTTYQGIVHNSKNKDDLPMAQVWIQEVHGPMESLEERNGLKWFLVDIGGGSGTDSGGYSLHAGQSVVVLQDPNDMTTYTVIKKVPFHEPETEKPNAAKANSVSVLPNAANAVNPNSVSTLPNNDKNFKDAYKNPALTEAPIAALVTANINKLQDTIFGKINNELIKIVNTALGDLQGLMAPFEDIISFFEGVFLPGWEPDIIGGYLPPNMTIGINDMVDLTKDMSRMVDAAGGAIGSISSLIKVDGWKAKSKDWDFITTDSNGIEVDSKGIIKIDQGLSNGLHEANFMIRDKSIEWSYIDDNIPEGILRDGVYTLLGAHWKEFPIKISVVPDLSILDFSLSINFLDMMPPAIIGPLWASDVMPKVEFTLDAKATDKATFGQLHVIGGVSDKTVSIEMDFSASDVVEKTSNKA